jgi:hypothetical protein
MTVLEQLRRRRATIAKAALPLLMAVWCGAFASPCLGMVIASGAAAQHAASHHVTSAESPSAHGCAGSMPHDGHCPHCPPGPGSSGAALSSAGCDALSNVADDGGQQPSVQPLKHLAAITVPGPAVMASLRRAAWSPPFESSAASTVPLNVRHCVFLI